MLTILSWCSLPSFLSTQHGEGTGKPFPGLDQCRISEAEMGCTEHSQESHRGALEGTQMPAVVRDKALPVGTHRNSAQGSKYEASLPWNTLENQCLRRNMFCSCFACWITWEQLWEHNYLDPDFLSETPGVIFASQPSTALEFFCLSRARSKYFHLNYCIFSSLCEWALTSRFPDSLPKGMLHLWQQHHTSVQVGTIYSNVHS